MHSSKRPPAQKLILFNALLVCLSFTGMLFAQAPVSSTWTLQQTTSAVTSGPINAADEQAAKLSVLYDAMAVFNTTTFTNIQKLRPSDNGGAWTARSSQDDSVYIQFAVTAKSGTNLHLNSIAFLVGAKGTNNLVASYAYSTDASFAAPTVLKNNVALPQSAKTVEILSEQFDTDVSLSAGEALYLRIYLWNVTGDNGSTSKYAFIQNLVISGTTAAATFPASAAWELTNPGAGGTGLTVATTGQVEAPDELLNNAEINQYTGPEGSQRVRIKGNAWPANQTVQIDTVFVQFAVAPKTGFTLHVKSLALGLAAASINTMKANIYYSTDPAFSAATKVAYSTGDAVNNYLRIDSLTSVSAAPNVTINPGETFYLRVYPWVDNDPAIRTGKYVCLKNVVIGGEVEGNPVAALVIWPFETDDRPVTTGPLVAQQQAYSSAMKFYGTTQLPKTDTGETVTVGAIQTVSQSWNAEPQPTDSLYFQYAVAPKFGGTFFVDSVSLYIGGWFTNNLRAAFYYSKDSSFTNKTLLIADTALVGNKVMPLGARLSVTINTGETFYLRVYPHNTQAEGWAKLVAVHQVIIAGTATGVTADPPTVTTATIANISTMFATSGGNIPTDGGAAVTARGVVWNTAGAPTIADDKTEDGAGSGSFKSQVTGLAPNTKYYLRAYATNEAGTAYGNELSFVTLDSIGVPTVVTTAISNILVKTAESGGQVTMWGGDSVQVRGVVWNTTGKPTIADNKTENGNGIGAFRSILYPLTANTKYYVRAYATNGKGTGYGNEIAFTTQSPASNVVKIVAKDVSGDYTTVQAAFNDVPDSYTGSYTIFVKKGVYYEKLLLDRNKVNVTLRGEDPDSTILTYDDYAGKAGGTSNAYSVAIEPDDFTAVNIIFQNTVKNDGSFGDQQAVALRVNGDRQSYYNCKLLGYQDTYYVWGGRATGRVYMKNCYIAGSVDFIFGRNLVVFDSCEIHINRQDGTLTAASTEAETKFGLVFRDCKITAEAVGFDGRAITSFVLGRPWQAAPRTVFINCEEPTALNPNGWETWNVPPALYAEYNCFGPGANSSNRIAIGRQLTATEAADYTLANIFAKTSNPGFAFDWLPEAPITTSVDERHGANQIPETFELRQNYPNPFNPSTTIQYGVPKSGRVKIVLYNMLGGEIMKLVDEEKAAGRYQIQLRDENLPSGIYFYKMSIGDFKQTKKMLLVR